MRLEALELDVKNLQGQGYDGVQAWQVGELVYRA